MKGFPCPPDFYPARLGGQSMVDPTHGRIDHDIQWQVEAMNPSSLAQRTALEETLQNKRNREVPYEIMPKYCSHGNELQNNCDRCSEDDPLLAEMQRQIKEDDAIWRQRQEDETWNNCLTCLDYE